ncbi:conserved hypothetical protein [gamma proteobacterium HdN1]|nr:conserved hypothetical protein [gamma proteobacterium HdN1]
MQSTHPLRTSAAAFLLAITAAGCAPTSSADTVKIQAQLNNYRGDGAYLAVYLTDNNGAYKQTLWISGKKPKYYKHLADWARGSGQQRSEYDGLSGASTTSGSTLKINADIAPALVDSGYQIRVDSAVEDQRDYRAEIIVPLTREGAGKPIAGKGYVQSLTYQF